jgi:hypothetical protein
MRRLYFALGAGVMPMHYPSHQSVIDDLEARILTIRDSL